jgi:uncharacterized glyoxalase superfamily protein PhnB
MVHPPEGDLVEHAETGAEMVRDLRDQPHGSRDFSVRDPGGNVWSLSTYRPASGP